jgi:hypothetical protein
MFRSLPHLSLFLSPDAAFIPAALSLCSLERELLYWPWLATCQQLPIASV